jgi:hypothetical protein
MRRVYQILLIIIIAGLVLLVLYAIPASISPTRPWMEATLGPPLSYIFGSTWSAIKNSSPYQFLLANPYLILVVGIVVGIFPISFPIIHRSFNTVRAKFTRSSIEESGLYPKQTFPTQVSTQLPQPEPTKTASAPAQTQPITPVAPTPEEKPEAEATA